MCMLSSEVLKSFPPVYLSCIASPWWWRIWVRCISSSGRVDQAKKDQERRQQPSGEKDQQQREGWPGQKDRERREQGWPGRKRRGQPYGEKDQDKREGLQWQKNWQLREYWGQKDRAYIDDFFLTLDLAVPVVSSDSMMMWGLTGGPEEAIKQVVDFQWHRVVAMEATDPASVVWSHHVVLYS